METTTDAVDVSQDLHTLLCCAQQSVQRFATSTTCHKNGGESDGQQHGRKQIELRELGASLGQAQHLAQTDLELCLQNVALAERLKLAASAQAMQLCLERRFAAVQRGALRALSIHAARSCEEAEPEAEVATDEPAQSHLQLQNLEDFIANKSNSALTRLTTAVDQVGTLTCRLEDAVVRADKTLMRLEAAQQPQDPEMEDVVVPADKTRTKLAAAQHRREPESVMTSILVRASQRLVCSCCRK